MPPEFEAVFLFSGASPGEVGATIEVFGARRATGMHEAVWIYPSEAGRVLRIAVYEDIFLLENDLDSCTMIAWWIPLTRMLRSEPTTSVWVSGQGRIAQIALRELVVTLLSKHEGLVHDVFGTKVWRSHQFWATGPEASIEFTQWTGPDRPRGIGIYGVGDAPGWRFLVPEHARGEALTDLMARGPMPFPDTLDICLQVASGIEAMHERGVVHARMGSGALFITRDHPLKVLGFGFDENSLLSPEVASGDPADRVTDIWSFGCILYECLTGTRPFRGAMVDRITQITAGNVDLSQLPEWTPAHVRELLAECLAKDRSLRLQSMGAARLRLERLRADAVPGASS